MLSWRVSVTLDSAFCIAALEEAIATLRVPDDLEYRPRRAVHQRSIHGLLLDHGIRISMDGRGLLARQHLRRTALALAQVRGGLSARLRLGVGGDRRHRSVRHASTTADDPTRAFPIEPPTLSTFHRCLTPRQPNRPSFHLSNPVPLYREPEPLHWRPAWAATFSKRDPDPHVGSYAVVDAIVFSGEIPITWAMTRDTSDGV